MKYTIRRNLFLRIWSPDITTLSKKALIMHWINTIIMNRMAKYTKIKTNNKFKI